MKLTSKAPSTTQRVLLYGGPKTGKSELAGKLSQYYNLYWFDAENGYIVLTKLPLDWQERIDIVSVPDSRVLPMCVETWLKIIKGTEHFVCEAHGKCSCALCKKNGAFESRVCFNEHGPNDIVVFDSLTQFTNSCISNITKTQPDDYKMDYGDWGQLGVLVDKFLSQVQAARYNIVCITHEAEVEMEDGKSKLVPVCGSSKSSRNTAKYFDHVVYVEVRNKKHVAGSGTDYSNTAVTGSRTNVKLEATASANLLDIFTSWKHTGTGGDRSYVQVNIPDTSVQAKEILKEESLENIPVVAQEQDGLQQIADSLISGKLIVDTRTPGQIALDNLKAKMAK